MPAEEQSPMQCPSPTIKIWRYFRLDKFELLLRHGGLYFSSVDRLLTDDQYEGSSDLSELEERQEYRDAVNASCESLNRYAPLRTMVNCWYSGEDESRAMWSLYATGGVCIESTLQDFCAECSSGRERLSYWSQEKGRMNCEGPVKEVFVDNIYYYNPKDPDLRPEPDLWRKKYTRKPIWFKHEGEVRALLWYPGTDMFSGAVIPERPVEAPVGNVSRTTDERTLASNRGC
jgi:hypothetical protein